MGIQFSQKVDTEDFSDEFLWETVGHSQRVAQEDEQMRVKGAYKRREKVFVSV